MKRRAFVSAALALMAIALAMALESTPAGATLRVFSASMDEAQDTTCASAIGATGTGNVSIETDTNVLKWSVTWSGLTGPAIAAHLHGPAGPGVGAGIQVPIDHSTNPSIGSTTITDTQRKDLLDGLWYLNVHTDACPGGEIRGQISGSETPVFLEASMDEAQDTTCASATGATGSGSVSIDTGTNLLKWSVTWSGLTGPATAAHFHGPAGPGVGAGIQVPIDHTTNPSIGSMTITNAQEADLLAHLWYLNVHTATCLGGEIRGQVTQQGVGGVAELPEVAGAPLEAPESSGSNAGLLAGLIAAVVAGAVALGGAAWYMRRRPA